MQKHLLGSWAALLAVDEHRLSSLCSSCEQRVGGFGVWGGDKRTSAISRAAAPPQSTPGRRDLALPWLRSPHCRQHRNYSKKMPWLSPPELVVRVWHRGECGHSSPRHTSTQAGQAAGQTQPKSFANLFLNNQEFCKGQILQFLGSPFLSGSHPPGSFHNCFQFLEEGKKKFLPPKKAP